MFKLNGQTKAGSGRVFRLGVLVVAVLSIVLTGYGNIDSSFVREIARGSASNSTFLAAQPASATGCAAYRYTSDADNATVVRPGSYVGCFYRSDETAFLALQLPRGANIRLRLTGPASADFDLYLIPPNAVRMSDVWSATGPTADEYLQVNVMPIRGRYLVAVHNYSGSFGYWRLDVSIFPQGSGNPTPTDSVAIQNLVNSMAMDLNRFWSQVFAASGQRYVPPQQLQGYDPDEAGARVCGYPADETAGNALYCTTDHSIYYDRDFFVVLHRNIGDMAVVFIVAHEWGHAVQRQLGFTDDRFYSIQLELQADCLAGAYTRHRAEKGNLTTRDLREAQYLLSQIGDPPNVSPTDANAHGSASQRTAAFNRGLANGVSGCSIQTR